MLSRGLLENEYLPAVLAHELGHLDTSDGKLTAALNRLIINPLPRTREKQPKERDVLVVGGERFLLMVTLFGAVLWVLRRLVRFAQGGLGLRFFGPVGRLLARTRVHRRSVRGPARAGRGARGLPRGARLIHDHPVPLIWLTEHTHPPAELRIDRLRKAGHTPAPATMMAPLDGPSQTPQAQTP
jgi:hypothetical protein